MRWIYSATSMNGEELRNSLRLVAIYTGEARINDIFDKVVAKLEEIELCPTKNGSNTKISYRHGCVVFYSKPGVNLPESYIERCVEEKDLPGRLIEDFSKMTDGLLPSIALTSMTAVREGCSHGLGPSFVLIWIPRISRTELVFPIQTIRNGRSSTMLPRNSAVSWITPLQKSLLREQRRLRIG